MIYGFKTEPEAAFFLQNRTVSKPTVLGGANYGFYRFFLISGLFSPISEYELWKKKNTTMKKDGSNGGDVNIEFIGMYELYNRYVN